MFRTDVVAARFTLTSIRRTNPAIADRTDARMVSTHQLSTDFTGYQCVLAVMALTVLAVPGM